MIAEQIVCDILTHEMSLSSGQVYLWNEKVMEPKNSALYIPVHIISCKAFGVTRRNVVDQVTGNLNQVQSVNMRTVLDINIQGRSTDARDRKEEIIFALTSAYSLQQQSANSFTIARLPENFNNLTKTDGAGILFRFSVSVAIQYFKQKTSLVDYYQNFPGPSLLVNK
jgi:hypothetical protein